MPQRYFGRESQIDKYRTDECNQEQFDAHGRSNGGQQRRSEQVLSLEDGPSVD